MKDCAKLYLKLKPNEETEIVLDHSEAFIISLQVQRFTELAQGDFTNFFSYRIAIPWELNKVVLNFILDKNVKGNDILKCGRIPARIGCGCLDFQGNIKFLGYDLKCKKRMLSAQYVGGLANWTNCVADKKLRDLDLGLFDPGQQNMANVIFNSNNPYDGSENYWISLKYIGGLTGESGVPRIYNQPDIYDAGIIDAINKIEDCPNICGDIFNTEWFRRLLFVNPSQGFDYTARTYTNNSVQNVGGTPFSSFIKFRNQWSFPSNFGAPFPISINDPITIGQLTDAIAFNSAIPRDPKVKVKFSGNLSNVQPGTTFQVTALGGVATNTLPSIIFPYNGEEVANGFNEFEFEFTAQNHEPSLQIAYGIGFSNPVLIDPNVKISFCFTSAHLLHDSEPFPLNQFLPDVSILDYLKDLFTWLNIVPFFDQKTNCVNIRPSWDAILSPTGEKVEGFYRPKEQARDITNEVECGISNGTFKVSENNCLNFCFCEDGSDQYANKAFEKTDRTYLDAKYCQPIQGQADAESKVSTTLTAATRSGDLPLNVVAGSVGIPIVPYILDAEIEDILFNAAITHEMKPRRLYKVGLVLGGWRESVFTGTGNTTANVIRTEYPYATQVDTDLGINLGWNDQDGIPGLANTFYPKTIDLQLNSGTKKARWMPDKIQLINQEEFFRTPVRIKDKVTGDCTFIVPALQRWMPCENLPGTGCFVEYPNT